MLAMRGTIAPPIKSPEPKHQPTTHKPLPTKLQTKTSTGPHWSFRVCRLGLVWFFLLWCVPLSRAYDAIGAYRTGSHYKSQIFAKAEALVYELLTKYQHMFSSKLTG